MQTDIYGKIKNTKLPITHPLLPLYEAIVNSIDAIEDAGNKNGRIDIYIVRDNQVLQEKDKHVIDEIDGFEISDNGIGFNEKNLISFETSDSMLKADRGGKGVGRFIWLVAFDRVQIESVYEECNKVHSIQFDFVPRKSGIENKKIKHSDTKNPKTTVKLCGFKEKYRKTCPKRHHTIAVHIIEHCLEYFIRSSCPNIWLHTENEESINLNSLFEKEMYKKQKTSTFNVKGTEFIIAHICLATKYIEEHTVNYLANDRVVKTEKLAKHIPNISRKLFDNDNEFVYAAYVDSKFLNNAVNMERTAFNIPDKIDMLESLTWNDIQKATLECCSQFLRPYTKPIIEEKEKRINSFVANQAPMFRPILKHIKNNIDSIPPDITDSELELRLYQAYQDLQMEARKEGKILFEDEVENTNQDEYKEAFKGYFDKLIDINKSDLARYICNRKVILDLFYKQLSKKTSGKYPLEEAVHNIIFPMGHTSDDVSLENHNLWLIDERLVYHNYLASDKKLSSNKSIAVNSSKEPDIIVCNAYDKACAFVDSDNSQYSSIVIIELKRPMRVNYNNNDNPFTQTRGYIKEINAGKTTTPDGRPITIVGSIPYYCYIICDINDKIETMAIDFELTKTPDGEGFFGYKRGYNAYYEVISYSKMLRDAQKRNAIFFEKLGLSSMIKQIVLTK